MPSASMTDNFFAHSLEHLPYAQDRTPFAGLVARRTSFVSFLSQFQAGWKHLPRPVHGSMILHLEFHHRSWQHIPTRHSTDRFETSRLFLLWKATLILPSLVFFNRSFRLSFTFSMPFSMTFFARAYCSSVSAPTAPTPTAVATVPAPARDPAKVAAANREPPAGKGSRRDCSNAQHSTAENGPEARFIIFTSSSSQNNMKASLPDGLGRSSGISMPNWFSKASTKSMAKASTNQQQSQAIVGERGAFSYLVLFTFVE